MNQLSIIEALDVVTKAIYDTVPNELQESDGKLYLAKNGKQLSDGVHIVETTNVIEKGNMRPITSNAVALMFEAIVEMIKNIEADDTTKTTAVLGVSKLGEMVLGKG